MALLALGLGPPLLGVSALLTMALASGGVTAAHKEARATTLYLYI
jgi:hypothetical protein